MNDYYDPCLKEYRLGLIEDAAKSSSGLWQFVRGDLADRELVNRVFREETPSIVVNLAAQAGGTLQHYESLAYIESDIFAFRTRSDGDGTIDSWS